MIDHTFLPCFYSKTPAMLNSCEALGLCLSPYGMFRCHIKGCGGLRKEHVRCCDGTDSSCPKHGTHVAFDDGVRINNA